jgi:FAD-dependent urate hydroxylase
MPQSDPDNVARETLRLIGPDPQNWVPEREAFAP